MNRKLNTSTRQRALKIFKDLIEYPYHYTIQDLARLNDVTKDTVRDDIQDIKNVGFDILFDKNYRYAFEYNKPLEHIKNMLYLSETEFQLIKNALKKADTNTNAINKTLQKIESIYDYTKYGNQTISKVYLKKINLIEKAKLDKQKVKLINYRSTSSQKTKDRILEVFHVSPKDDTLQGFDAEHQEVRIFKISRFDRLEQIDEDWDNEGKHHVLHPDLFGIVSRSTKKVHLKMDIAALNALLDKYPLAKAYSSPSVDQPNLHELEISVNDKFIGLTNYILGNYDHILEIIEPQELIDTLNEKIKNMLFE